MKQVFYVIYVLAFSGAVFMTGIFIGQFLERRRTARAGRTKESEKKEKERFIPVTALLHHPHSKKSNSGKN